jgi:hypothetical protein
MWSFTCAIAWQSFPEDRLKGKNGVTKANFGKAIGKIALTRGQRAPIANARMTHAKPRRLGLKLSPAAMELEGQGNLAG